METIRVAENQLAIDCGPNEEEDNVYLQILRSDKIPDEVSIGIGTEIEFGYGDHYGVTITREQAQAVVDFITQWLNQ